MIDQAINAFLSYPAFVIVSIISSCICIYIYHLIYVKYLYEQSSNVKTKVNENVQHLEKKIDDDYVKIEEKITEIKSLLTKFQSKLDIEMNKVNDSINSIRIILAKEGILK